jgi:hypothetical protein
LWFETKGDGPRGREMGPKPCIFQSLMVRGHTSNLKLSIAIRKKWREKNYNFFNLLSLFTYVEFLNYYWRKLLL